MYTKEDSARLLGCRPPVHPGVAEQPPEELVLLERGSGEAAPLGGEPHVAACHLDERPGRQARQSFGDARPRDAQALRDVGVAAEPPLGADDENRLEVVLGGFAGCHHAPSADIRPFAPQLLLCSWRPQRCW